MSEFTPSGFFVLRTPLLPVQDFLALSDGLGFFQALRQGGDLVSALTADHKLVRDRLRKLAERSEVKEALWLASPEFFETLPFWSRDPESNKGVRLEHSLYRYVARMTSRPTPFGLFAGCTLGTIGPQTQVELGPRSTYYRRSRLDMEYLCNLAERISADPRLQSRLPFRPNTSLYLAAGRYHHIQAYLNHDQRAYRLVATEPSSFLTATLQRSASGATPFDLASALIKDDPEISIEEAQQYVRDLIESQLLVSDLTPPVTGPEPMQDMLAHLNNLEDSSIKTALGCISERLNRLDQRGVGNDVQGYEEIVTRVGSLPGEFKRDHLVQVDMMKPARAASLDQRLIRSILQAVEVLHSLVPSAKEGPLQQFKKDFRDRYQQQEIPLLLALDEEVGIGFEHSGGPGSVPELLLEDLDLSGAADGPVFKAAEAEFILLREVQQLAEEKKDVLELDDSLLESLRVQNPLRLPDAFAVLGTLVGPSPESGDKISFCLQSVTGPSGALLLGRFCHADDQLAGRVQKHLRSEEAACLSDKAVFAEIAHLPEGRIGNVLCRPHLREYEIPFLASSRLSDARQVEIADLLVSVQNDRIVLRSQRLRSEVIPRLTSAHNYSDPRNLKVYKFLCLLQTQGVSAGLGWDWGIVDQLLFLPRVVLEDIVLAPARWRLTKQTIQKFSRERGIKRLRQVDEWRTRMRAPRFVLLAESDNQLLIDLENVLSVETLVEYISKRDSARLMEMVPEPRRLCVHGPEGIFTSEVVIPFARESRGDVFKAFIKDDSTSAKRESATPLRKIRRTFLPGSEWLFAKIYASPSQVDHLLLRHVAPLVEKIIALGEAECWFFVRYSDPHWHLRLRFHGDAESLRSRVLPQLSECLEQEREQGRVLRVQLDTYEREIERYGGPNGMEIAERLFQFDSELTLDLLGAISNQLGGGIRWHLAFCSMDTLLAALGFDVTARRELVNRLAKGQEQNFAIDHGYRKQLSAKFRDNRLTLEKLLQRSSEELPQAAVEALQRFAGRLKAIRLELESLEQRGELNKTIPDLAGSYVHMHLNRMLRSAANAQEMVLYDFLARMYDSKLARADKR